MSRTPLLAGLTLALSLLLSLVLSLVLSLTLAPAYAQAVVPEAASARAGVASRTQWLADVKTAMKGSRAYVRERVADSATDGDDERLAINFDIDNTVLATYYDGGGAIPQMRRFSRFLERQGVEMVFNTGRLGGLRRVTEAQLESAGFPVAGLCLRGPGRTLEYSKQRCRDLFTDRGFTLIANVGNNDTDFAGDGYEGRAFRLPNYGSVLG